MEIGSMVGLSFGFECIGALTGADKLTTQYHTKVPQTLSGGFQGNRAAKAFPADFRRYFDSDIKVMFQFGKDGGCGPVTEKEAVAHPCGDFSRLKTKRFAQAIPYINYGGCSGSKHDFLAAIDGLKTNDPIQQVYPRLIFTIVEVETSACNNHPSRPGLDSERPVQRRGHIE